ncbi:unnamed protein product [Paramecium octaurelia]|uniref:Uncharacterized protein n=1 Tax=Paramecium octaurelia TaxID=43137 RepID=A0A8S1WXT5_PAROT|nr:unnamed protein product [Paramecium octaurelia]
MNSSLPEDEQDLEYFKLNQRFLLKGNCNLNYQNREAKVISTNGEIIRIIRRIQKTGQQKAIWQGETLNTVGGQYIKIRQIFHTFKKIEIIVGKGLFKNDNKYQPLIYIYQSPIILSQQLQIASFNLDKYNNTKCQWFLILSDLNAFHQAFVTILGCILQLELRHKPIIDQFSCYLYMYLKISTFIQQLQNNTIKYQLMKETRNLNLLILSIYIFEALNQEYI